MALKQIFMTSFFLALIGALSFHYFGRNEDVIWFGIGSIGGLLNFSLISLLVTRGLQSGKKKGAFLSFLLLKTFSFLGLLLVCLMLLKPSILPFTLGVTIVIVGAFLWALFDYFRRMAKGKLHTSS